MADYKETDVSGVAWQRAYQILILNPLGELPTVRYDEEQVINLNDEQIKQPVNTLGYTVDPLGIIELRDPVTLELTGETIPVALVHQALFSDYINRAQTRDAEKDHD
nr:MAG: hypothetical protein [Caudoviricetes sp.]